MATNVYCDDAGFTGDNLLNAEQPFFAYSAVAIDADHAAALTDELRVSFGIRGGELKGKDLYARGYAVDLIRFLAGTMRDRVSVALNHKLYSLAAKFFEYVYEPSIAANSRFFYDRGTHIYVATALWAYLSAGDDHAERIVRRFEQLMRRRAGQEPGYFDDGIQPGAEAAISPIVRFAFSRKDQAMAELELLGGDDGRILWALDLSLSSARSVLATLGERFGEIDVTFDESKPLESFSEFMPVFVDRPTTEYMEIGGRRRPLTFNLARAPRFGSSECDPGLQLADIFASFAALAARDRYEAKGHAILDTMLPLLDADTVFPDHAAIDLTRKSTVMNAVLVAELADRAEAGIPLLEGIEDHLETLSFLYDRDPPRFALGED